MYVARLDTVDSSTVGDVTEQPSDSRKTSQIPPNAASRHEVDRVRSRVDDLGVTWHDAVAKADLGRNVGFKLLRGHGSVASLRKIDEWAASEESRRPSRSKDQKRTSKTAEWATLGAELAELDPAKFESMLDGLRDLVKAKRDEGAAILKMFRPNPDR